MIPSGASVTATPPAPTWTDTIRVRPRRRRRKGLRRPTGALPTVNEVPSYGAMVTQTHPYPSVVALAVVRFPASGLPSHDRPLSVTSQIGSWEGASAHQQRGGETR